MKAHYDIVFKNVIRKSENSQMDLNSFFDALEDIANRAYGMQGNAGGKKLVTEVTYENLKRLVGVIIQSML